MVGASLQAEPADMEVASSIHSGADEEEMEGLLRGRARSMDLQLGGQPLQSAAILRKIHWHIMPKFCLLTVLNHMDRANLAYASVQLTSDLGFSASVYGTGSSVFFLGYMLFQVPSQLAAERVGLRVWITVLMVGWGVIATSFVGLTNNPTRLYTLRFLLGAFEAGTFPAMWSYLTHFYAGGPELAVAWGFIGAAQPLAQALGAPIAAALLMTDGLLGLRGWQWLFMTEGLPTICAGIWMCLTLAPSPLQATFLTAPERDYVHQRVKTNKEQMARSSGDQTAFYGMRCWKVYAQGLGSAWAGVMRYGAMYFTPLIVYSIINGDSSVKGARTAAKGAGAVLLAGIPYTWSAIATLLNSRHAKQKGEMYWHLLVPLFIGTVGALCLGLTLGHSAWLAFLALIVSATSQASNPLEWGYPATYLHGTALSSGWAVANCISGFGGVLGPWMIGTLKAQSGHFIIPMLTIASVNMLATLYFAVLLRHLPATRSGAAEEFGSPACPK